MQSAGTGGSSASLEGPRARAQVRLLRHKQQQAAVEGRVAAIMNKKLKGGPTGLQAHVSQVVAQARLVSAGLGREHRHGLHVLSRILARRKGKRGCCSPSHGQPQQSEPTLLTLLPYLPHPRFYIVHVTI